MPVEGSTAPRRRRRQRAVIKRAPGLLALAAVATTLAACVGSLTALDDRGRGVAVIAAPMPGCTFVAGSAGHGYFREYALNELRNRVGAGGASHLVVTDETQMMQGFLPVGGDSLTIKGIGYRCPVSATAPGAKPQR